MEQECVARRRVRSHVCAVRVFSRHRGDAGGDASVRSARISPSPPPSLLRSCAPDVRRRALSLSAPSRLLLGRPIISEPQKNTRGVKKLALARTRRKGKCPTCVRRSHAMNQFSSDRQAARGSKSTPPAATHRCCGRCLRRGGEFRTNVCVPSTNRSAGEGPCSRPTARTTARRRTRCWCAARVSCAGIGSARRRTRRAATKRMATRPLRKRRASRRRCVVCAPARSFRVGVHHRALTGHTPPTRLRQHRHSLNHSVYP